MTTPVTDHFFCSWIQVGPRLELRCACGEIWCPIAEQRTEEALRRLEER